MSVDIKKLQQDIDNLEKQIKLETSQIDQLEGKLEVLEQQLKKDFDANTIEEAQKKLKEYDTELVKLEEEQKAVEEELDALLNKKP